jgi:hypothetical protein
MAGAVRSLSVRSLPRRRAGWSYVTWTSFSPVFWLPTFCAARTRLISTLFALFGAWMFVVTCLRIPI